MAIYHLTAKVGSTKYGASAKAKADYITRSGRYAGREDKAVFVASENMPEWAKDHRAYWTATDKFEAPGGAKRAAKLFYELEFALPVELNDEQRQKLALDFAREVAQVQDIQGGKLPFTLAIHEGKGKNPHAHLVVSERANVGQDLEASDWFKRRVGARKTRELQPKSWLLKTRERWATRCNQALELAGEKARIDHLSHQERGLKEQPTIHLGYKPSPRRRDLQDKIIEHNKILLKPKKAKRPRLNDPALREERTKLEKQVTTWTKHKDKPGVDRTLALLQYQLEALYNRDKGMSRGQAEEAIKARFEAWEIDQGYKTPSEAPERPQETFQAQKSVDPRPGPQKATERPRRHVPEAEMQRIQAEWDQLQKDRQMWISGGVDYAPDDTKIAFEVQAEALRVWRHGHATEQQAKAWAKKAIEDKLKEAGLERPSYHKKQRRRRGNDGPER